MERSQEYLNDLFLQAALVGTASELKAIFERLDCINTEVIQTAYEMAKFGNDDKDSIEYLRKLAYYYDGE